MARKGQTWHKGKTAEIITSFAPCERAWLDELGESVQSYYPNYWQQFKDFIGMTADGIIEQRADDMQLRRDNPKRWRFEELAKRFYISLYKDRDPPLPTNTDRTKLTVVQSFFSHNRMPLEFKRGEIKEPVSTRKYYEYSLADLEAAKKFGGVKERWIFLGGKSLGQRVTTFSQIRRDQIEPLLNEESSVPIDIVTTKKSGLIAHPCLDRDALEAAQDLIAYLDQADPDKNNPYMLPGYKGSQMTKKAIGDAIERVADVAHAADPRVFRYKERNERLRFHNFRKFLNAALQNAHVDEDLRDWIIGHKLSSTKKAYTTHQRHQAYRDAEKFLSLPSAMITEGEYRIKAAIDNLRVSGKFSDEQLRQMEREWLGKPVEVALKGISLEAQALERIIERNPYLIDPDEPTYLIPKEMIEREIEEIEREKSKSKSKTNSSNRQMIVDEEDLPNHLNHGYEFVSVLPSGKILIRKIQD